MKNSLLLIIHLLVTIAKVTRARGAKALIAENLLLRQQLIVMSPAHKRAPNLSAADRFVFGGCALFIFSTRRLPKRAVTIQRSTILRFQQVLVKCKYRLLFPSKRSGKPGPKGPSKELIEAIVEMKRRNPRFGCLRIAQQINLAFGTNIDKDLVHRILAKHYHLSPKGNGPSWLTYIGLTKDSLWNVDLFRCGSILLHPHWVLVVMDQYTRRIVGFSVQAGVVDCPTLCRMLYDAIARKVTPKYLSTDIDPLFLYHRWLATLSILEVDEIKTVPRVPLSHPFIERLILRVRKEFLDQRLFSYAQDLTKKLTDYQSYYSERSHKSLNGITPLHKAGKVKKTSIDLHHYQWQTHCHGLFEFPAAA